MKLFAKTAVFIATLLCTTVPKLQAQSANFHVVPLPKVVRSTQTGDFTLNARTLICYPQGNKQLKQQATMLANYIKQLYLFLCNSYVKDLVGGVYCVYLHSEVTKRV